MRNKIVIFKNDAGNWSVRLVGGNGQILNAGWGYNRVAGALKMLRSLRQLLALGHRPGAVHLAENGEYYSRVQHPRNHFTLLVSETFKARASALKNLRAVWRLMTRDNLVVHVEYRNRQPKTILL